MGSHICVRGCSRGLVVENRDFTAHDASNTHTEHIKMTAVTFVIAPTRFFYICICEPRTSNVKASTSTTSPDIHTISIINTMTLKIQQALAWADFERESQSLDDRIENRGRRLNRLDAMACHIHGNRPRLHYTAAQDRRENSL
jgi:hypothetical protein